MDEHARISAGRKSSGSRSQRGRARAMTPEFHKNNDALDGSGRPATATCGFCQGTEEEEEEALKREIVQ